MTFPFQFHFGSVEINAHFVFEVMAYILGFQYLTYLRKRTRDAISFEQRMWVILAGAAGALVGSRCVGYFSVPADQLPVVDIWINWMRAKSILGGLLGGVIGVEIGKKCMGIKVYTGDLFVYPVIVAIMIGRIGCFSQGVFDGTHGSPSNVPWAMDMGDGIPRHPAQLYEIIFLGLLWFILTRIESKLSNGSRFKLFMIAYLIYRFLFEFIKPYYPAVFGLSAVHITCLIGIIYYLPVLLKPKELWR